MFSLSKLYVILGACALSAIVAGAGSWYVTHGLDERKYLAREVALRDAEAKAQSIVLAVERSMAAVRLGAALKEADRQRFIASQFSALLQEVNSHVSNNSTCVSYGLIRVLDAAVHGVSADQLPLPAGQSDDACAPVTPPALAAHIIRNYERAKANAEQLNGLEEMINDLHASSANHQSAVHP